MEQIHVNLRTGISFHQSPCHLSAQARLVPSY